MLKQRRTWRAAALILLAVAILGPWGYTSDGLPPPEWCQPPNILLEGGGLPGPRCVRSVPGIEMLAFGGQVLWGLPFQVLSGALSLENIERNLLFVLLSGLAILPFASTLLANQGREARLPRLINGLAWGLALAPALLVARGAPAQAAVHLWGVWLFAGLAAAAAVLELAGLRRSKPGA